MNIETVDTYEGTDEASAMEHAGHQPLLVEGHALVWEEGDITYRLETSLSLDEAVKIAESLR